jgi:hypothetical protein
MRLRIAQRSVFETAHKRRPGEHAYGRAGVAASLRSRQCVDEGANPTLQPVVAPAEDILLAAWSGAWQGAWANVNPRSHLIVEKIEGDGATVLYTWSGYTGLDNVYVRQWRIGTRYSQKLRSVLSWR